MYYLADSLSVYLMSPNAATKGTERDISMDTSKALRQSEAPQAWSEIIPLGFLPPAMRQIAEEAIS